MQRSRDRLFKRAVGLLVLATIIAALYLLHIYNRETNPFTEKFVLAAYLDRADGVRVDMPVTLIGIPIGRVSRLEVADNGAIRLLVEIDNRYIERIRAGSVATVIRPLLGNASIDISIGAPDQPRLVDLGVLPLQRTPEIGEIVATLPARLERVDSILGNVERVSETFGQPGGPLQESLQRLNSSMLHLETLTADLARKDGAFRRSLENLEVTTQTVVLITDRMDQAIRKIDAAADTANIAVTRLNELFLTAGKGVEHLPELISNAQQVVDNLGTVSAALAEVAPQVGELSETTRNTLHDADEVLRAAKRNFLLAPSIEPYQPVELEETLRSAPQ